MALLPRRLDLGALFKNQPASANHRTYECVIPMPDFPELNRLIHEPARLAIIAILYQIGEADFLYLKREGNLTQGNLSSHLAKLEEAGYVEIKKTFKGKLPLTLCRLTPQGQEVFTEYCKSMSRILALPEPATGLAPK
jgi:DNA-binding MarR family transcriptional regulator